MKELFAIMLIQIFPLKSISQNCDCPSENCFNSTEKPVKTFLFSNKKTIQLCGGTSFENKDTLYSGFTLRFCDQSEPIYGDRCDEIVQSIVKKTGDALLVENLYGLPIGKNFKIAWEPFYVSKFFFKNGSMQALAYYRKDIRKYSQTQISQVLQQYKQLTKSNGGDRIINIANMLFWGYVSGNQQCEVYLNTIEKKFGPFDGATAEDWNHIIVTHEHWKKLNKK